MSFPTFRITKRILSLFCFSAWLLLSSFNLQQTGEPVYSVFLIGDAGAASNSPVLTLLESELAKAGDQAAVVYLGNNISPKGMPPAGHDLRAKAEQTINAQIKAIRRFEGQKVLIPGNHDWANGKGTGLERLGYQERYIEDALDSQNVFLPTNGCPGPVEIELDQNITLIVLDSQWFLHQGEKPTESCSITGIADIASLFQDALKRNASKKVIVATHHPTYANGGQGGLFGNIQSSNHPVYKRFRDALVSIMVQHPDLVHVGGHDHVLAHRQKDGRHYVTSGTGSSNDGRTKQGEDVKFAASALGYTRIDYYADGVAMLNFITPDQGNPKTLYSSVISDTPFAPSTEDAVAANSEVSYAGRDTLFAASKKYIGRSKFHRSLFGENYRKEWAAEMKFPIFDIATEKGGLKILKKGGGHQTISLRLEASDGKQYVLRSMDKNPALTLPAQFRKSFVKSLVQDGISASHPYAPLVIAPLADAAGIHHANPKVVFIPKDPRFGIYQDDLANSLAIFEERANQEQIGEPFFGDGTGTDVISSPDLYLKLKKDNDNEVDEKFVVRNRLFDMLLGDWDRHDDQWRWIEYKGKDDSKVYKPVPRDRDQVFFSGEGSFKKLAASKWAQPAFKGFNDEITYTPAYGFYRIRWFDRYFMTEPSLEDWLKEANELKAALTDELIESSIKLWPEEIYNLRGEEVIRKLKNRRDRLDEYAEDYFKFVSKEVDIRGSDKREYFVVERLNDEDTKVTVYKISKKGNRDKVVYQRTFKTSITKEIRLFGFAGEDEFEVRGSVNKGILVRIIAGEGNDKISDLSSVKAGGKKTLVYDQLTGNDLTTSKETKDLRSDKDPNINRYNMEEFDFNSRIPLPSINFNPDDGLFLGMGFIWKKDGFRKEPYASSQTLVVNHAFATSSYNIDYKGTFIDAIGKADFALEANAKAPNFVYNFFGLGNETVYDDNIDLTYYRTRVKEYSVKPSINVNLGKKANLNLGTSFRSMEVQESGGRLITDFPNNGLDPVGLFRDKNYLGGNIGFHYDGKDNPVVPTKGITFNTAFAYSAGINDNSENSAQWNSNITFRVPLGPFARSILATRVGYQKSFGDFEFFQASQLDGFNTLRGYRRYRFAGESSFYHQLDLRIELFEWQNYVIPSKVGLILFNDIGRVWVDNEDSNTLHHGYGGGIYLTPFSMIAINFIMAKSEEDFLPLVKFGFYF